MKLYELSAECEMMYQLLDDLEDNPELKQAYADTLEGLSGEFDEKAEAIAIIVKRFEAEAEAISQELRRMEERKKSKVRKAKCAREYLLSNMQLARRSKVETARAVISIRNNAESVQIEDSAAFLVWAEKHDDTLLTYKPPEISKTAVKDAIRAGKQLPGASLVRTQTIQIK